MRKVGREDKRKRRAEDPDHAREYMREYMRKRRAEDPDRYLRSALPAARLAHVREHKRKYMRKRRAEDPDRFFQDTWQTSLIGQLRGTRPSKLVSGLRKACTMPPGTDDDIFDHLKAQTPPRAKKWMRVATWGKGKDKCELDHMFPKQLKSGIEGVTGYKHTLEDVFRM